MQFRVGVVVLATMIVGGLMATFNASYSTGWLPWGRGRYEIGIAVQQAPGVDKKTPVRKNGILIGRVKSIEDQKDGVLIRTEIDGDRELYAEYEPHIRTTVLGDATIDFLTGRTPGPEPVPPGYVFPGQADPNPFDSLGKLGDLREGFAEASRSLADAGNEVRELASRVNKAFGEESGPDGEGRVKRLLDTTERAMNQFAQTMHSFNEIFGDEPGVQSEVAQPPYNTRRPVNGQPPFNSQPTLNSQPPFNTQPPINAQPPFNGQPPAAQPPGTQPPVDGQQMRQRLRQGLNELPDAIREFRATLQQSQGVLQSAERNFKNLEGFTEPLGQKGGDIAASILKAIEGLDQLVKDLGDVAQALNNREGTVGQLIHDRKVYDNLNVLMFNLNKVLGDIDELTFNLKPVIHNARIFLDKVATEPGRLIGGAINPSVVK
jgi:phospholipid/cholesterol/gamma-HCH transport system substrate-binding protein